MADIFSEVDEEVRKDRSLQLWKAYGKYIIGASVLLVGVTAAVVGWREYQNSQAREQGRQFEQAVQLMAEDKYQEAADTFGLLAKEGSASYKALASIRQASALVKAGKGETALVVYDEVAASEVAEEFKSLARILAGYYLMDNGTTEDVRSRVSGLEVSGGIWSASAQELLALAAMKDGNTEEAKKLLTALSEDAGAPQALKSRADQLLQTLN
ncbi:tetratricopeptide repeat protein [Sneathiella limimaris]|uniref:tetratricopeptide repeat protein n=1 Tax=Sneathiella limimaris TaxID=1964213 RepID=UPI001469E2B5